MSEVDIDVAMTGTYFEVSQMIKEWKSKMAQGKQMLIGIAGPPGAGKTTFCARISSLLENSKVVPMDGYHFSKLELSNFSDPDEAFRRRGAHWTFNAEKFVSDIITLRKHGEGNFASFDHAIGDPIENDIKVDKSIDIVIIEGNYLLLDVNPWSSLKEVMDYTLFLNCDIDVLGKRIIERHTQKMGLSREDATLRFESSDKLNAIEILGSKNKADRIIESL